MAFNLVEVEFKVVFDHKIVMSGTCPTFFVNTLANLYLSFDNPSSIKFLEITCEGRSFIIYAPIL